MRTFFTAKFSTSIVMTMESSWLGSVPWKSESEKVMGGILPCVRSNTACTCWTALRCLFLEEEDLHPSTNPPDIVLIVPRRGGLSSTSRGCDCGGSLCSVFWLAIFLVLYVRFFGHCVAQSAYYRSCHSGVWMGLPLFLLYSASNVRLR